MVVFNKFFSSVLLAVLYASFGDAAPSTSVGNGKHSTHYVRELESGVTLEAYHPEPTYQTFGDGLALEPSFGPQSLEQKTVGFVASQLKVDADKIAFKSGFDEEGRSFGYARQSHDNIPFVNAAANVAFKDNKVVAFGSSFVPVDKIAGSIPTVELDSTVIAKVEQALGAKKNDIEPTVKYLALPDGSSALVHTCQVESDDGNVWYEAYVDAHSGELLSATNFISHSSYRVLPAWKSIPTDGLELLADPQDASVSPNGWHDGDGTTTSGNKQRPVRNSSRYGNLIPFTYSGQSGKAYMYYFTITNPTRDSLFENVIPIHEFTHGLSNRMTGGGTANCLTTLEARGLGEGWSDAVAEWFYHTGTEEFKDFVNGVWVLNNPAGGRMYPYSTSTSVNPLKYSFIPGFSDEHDIGEVWANMLHNIYGALIDAHGWSSTARTNPSGSEGNVIFLQLLVDALALQPCNPTFPAARDAWIQADVNRYGGANKCLLWKVFASRGLGVGAANRVDSTAVPSDC